MSTLHEQFPELFAEQVNLSVAPPVMEQAIQASVNDEKRKIIETLEEQRTKDVKALGQKLANLKKQLEKKDETIAALRQENKKLQEDFEKFQQQAAIYAKQHH
jgi:predicted nuclease with TOPRIM domain